MIGASLGYLYFIHPLSAVMVLGVGLFVYGMAQVLMRTQPKWKPLVLGGSVSAIMMIMLLVKTRLSTLAIVGISFYCFQGLAYLVDVYRGKEKGVCKIEELLLAFCFFPKIMSGPIERVQRIAEQREQIEQVKAFDRMNLSVGLNYLLCGAFFKMGIADRCGVFVDAVYENIDAFDSITLGLNALIYSVQIYTDFAGYTLLALGFARLLGIKLTDNFRCPYLAVNSSDFWSRWHITLSSFLKEYLYIPLGGNRKGLVRKCLNGIAVFLVCGIWHGVGFKYLIWGMIHGLYTVAGNVVRIRSRLLTFLVATIAWIFFRASSLREGVVYLSTMLRAGTSWDGLCKHIEEIGFLGIEGYVLLVSIICLGIMECLANRKGASVASYLLEIARVPRFVLYYLMIIFLFVFGIYGNGFVESQYIYMQF